MQDSTDSTMLWGSQKDSNSVLQMIHTIIISIVETGNHLFGGC